MRAYQHDDAPMNAMPLVSIIIPSFNQGRFIRETLESVFAQDYPHIEVIVIDGGSTDGSVEIIREYAARLAHWESEKDRGQSHAINKGYARCTGEIVNWLCSDDVLLPGALSSVVSAFQSHPEAVAVQGHTLLTDENSKVLSLYPGKYSCYEDLLCYWVGRVDLPQPALFLRRSLIDGEPYFLDEQYHYAMDYDFWCRVFNGRSVWVIDEPLATYRRHADAKTTATENWRPERNQISRRYWGRPFSTAYLRRMISYQRVMRKIRSRKRWDEAVKLRSANQRKNALIAWCGFVGWQPEALFDKNTHSMLLSLCLGQAYYMKLIRALKAGPPGV